MDRSSTCLCDPRPRGPLRWFRGNVFEIILGDAVGQCFVMLSPLLVLHIWSRNYVHNLLQGFTQDQIIASHMFWWTRGC